jgi:hypothetical protein
MALRRSWRTVAADVGVDELIAHFCMGHRVLSVRSVSGSKRFCIFLQPDLSPEQCDPRNPSSPVRCTPDGR